LFERDSRLLQHVMNEDRATARDSDPFNATRPENRGSLIRTDMSHICSQIMVYLNDQEEYKRSV